MIMRKYPLACYAAHYRDHARMNPEDTQEPSIVKVICQIPSHLDKRKPLLPGSGYKEILYSSHSGMKYMLCINTVAVPEYDLFSMIEFDPFRLLFFQQARFKHCTWNRRGKYCRKRDALIVRNNFGYIQRRVA